MLSVLVTTFVFKGTEIHCPKNFPYPAKHPGLSGPKVFCKAYVRGSLSVDPRPAAPAAAVNLLEMHILRPQLGSTESESLGV